ncbi:hypothetical protein K8R61_02605 [bacterium]|nr:hypothetical protein [bacterium]
MNKKLIMILVLFLIVIVILALTSFLIVRKINNENVNKNQNINKITNDNTNQNNQTEKNKGYTIKTGENGWKILRSEKCGFEISFPDKFELLKHCYCEKFPHHKMSIKTLIGISSYSDKNIYGADGDLSLSIRSMSGNKSNINAIELKVGEKIEGYNSKLGKTITTVEQIKFMGTSAKVINEKYLNPIEGPSGSFMILNFNHNQQTYIIQAQIPFSNQKMVET